MKQSIEIEVPDGYEVKYDPASKKIDIVKKLSKPKSWEEYCQNLKFSDRFYRLDSTDSVVYTKHPQVNNEHFQCNKTLVSSMEEAIAFRALMQLRLLRKAWVDEWEPDYGTDEHSMKNNYCIVHYGNCDKIVSTHLAVYTPLTFPSKEMSDQFLMYFKDLIEEAKMLL